MELATSENGQNPLRNMETEVPTRHELTKAYGAVHIPVVVPRLSALYLVPLALSERMP